MLKELGTVLGFSWYFCSHIAVFHPTSTLQIDTEKENLIPTTPGKLTRRWTGSGALLERMAPSQAGDLDQGLSGFERERKLCELINHHRLRMAPFRRFRPWFDWF